MDCIHVLFIIILSFTLLFVIARPSRPRARAHVIVLRGLVPESPVRVLLPGPGSNE